MSSWYLSEDFDARSKKKFKKTAVYPAIPPTECFRLVDDEGNTLSIVKFGPEAASAASATLCRPEPNSRDGFAAALCEQALCLFS